MPLTTVSPGMLDTTAQYYSFKNRIINGAMVIDQRNAGASVTANDAVFPVDRFSIRTNRTGIATVQRSTVAPAGFTNSILFTSSAATSLAAGDYMNIAQFIEGFNVADLGWGTANAQTVTLSFWVRSSLTGTFGGSIANTAANRSYPFTYTISAANTFEQKTITIPGDTTGTWPTDNSGSIRLWLGLGVGSTLSGTAGAWAASGFISATGATSVVGTNGATFYITGVQLEKGSTATSFDYRPYGTELALCQRYYEVSTSVFSNVMFSGYVVGGGNTYYANGIFKVTKRANPTVTLTSTFGLGFNNTSGAAEAISPESFYEGRGSIATVNNGYFSSTFSASAEL